MLFFEGFKVNPLFSLYVNKFFNLPNLRTGINKHCLNVFLIYFYTMLGKYRQAVRQCVCSIIQLTLVRI